MDSFLLNTTPALSSLDISRRAEIWHALIDIACNAANAQLDGLTTRLASALLRTADEATNPKEAQRRANMAQQLKKNRYPFYYIVSERLALVLRQEVRTLGVSFDVPIETVNPLKLLSPEAEVDKKICLIKTSHAIEDEHVERLTTLNLQLAQLLDRQELTTAENPFRPHVFVSLLHDAWCEFQPDSTTHHVIYPLLQPGLCLHMAPILHLLSSALAKHGIQAKLSAPVSPENDTAVIEHPSDTPLVRQLRRLFPAQETAPIKNLDRPPTSDLPILFEDATLQATAARNELLGYLEGIQKTLFDRHLAACAGSGPHAASMLSHVKRHAPQSALTSANESTIDLVAKVFDTVLGDKNIPDEIKTAIGSLQVPVLKAALLDSNFFFSDAHPARRVIELLAKLGIGWDVGKGQADPLYPIIQRNIKRIQQESEQRTSVFAVAAQDLESFIAGEDAAAQQLLAEHIVLARRNEKTQQATRAAKQEVALRIGSGEVVAFVETFLENKWVPVLTLAYGVKDEKPQVLDSALRTMDDLCWSVKPKITPSERKEFLVKLPDIVVRLNKWLDAIQWSGTDRTRFFTELAECHASIVRAPVELSPERQLQLALAIAKNAAERRLQRQAAQMSAPAPDLYDEQMGQLAHGAWMEFELPDGSRLKAKLAWISPLRHFYIFSTKERQEVLSLSAEELAQYFCDRRARIMALPGLVERALAEALGVGHASNDALRSASAA